MSEDFFDNMGEVALGSRLKRLSDRLYSDASSIYQYFNLPIQPKWFAFLNLLNKHDKIEIVEASKRLGLSQPALSQYAKQLADAQIVEIVIAKNDNRKRQVVLSEYGKVVLQSVAPTWECVELAAKQLSRALENDFYQSICKFEKALEEATLLERTRQIAQLRFQDQTIEFIPFSDSLAHYFKTINSQWIDDMFKLENIDLQVLNSPKEHIIDKGGHIWFAKHPQFGIIGTCALLKSGKDEYELTKMGVLKHVRGLKAGQKLLNFVISQIDTLPIKKLYLLTNKKCEAAIHLYEKIGFEHSKEVMRDYGCHYQRCNVAMLFNRAKLKLQNN